MARTAKKLRRLADVFHDLETVERARVGVLTQEMNGLRDARDDILRSLENPSAINGLFTALFSSRIARIERQLQRLSQDHEAALERYAEAAARGRSADRLYRDARAEDDRKMEQADLESLLEFQQGKAAQGRGKSPGSS